MAIANFEQLHEGLREIAGVGVSALQRTDDGTWVFSLWESDVKVVILEIDADPGTAYVTAEVGEPPPEVALQRWLDLLSLNALLPNPAAPRFSRHPRTGMAVVHCACSLHELTVRNVYTLAKYLTKLTRCSRENFVTSEGAQDAEPFAQNTSTGPLDPLLARTCMEKFRELCTQIAGAMGTPSPAIPAGTSSCALDLTVCGTPVFIQYLPHCTDDCAVIGASLGLDTSQATIQDVTTLMEANFFLFANKLGAVYCHDARRQEFVLQYAYPLDPADGATCLQQIRAVASFIKDWNTHGIAAAADRVRALLSPRLAPGMVLG